MKLYYPIDHYNVEHKTHLFPILRNIFANASPSNVDDEKFLSFYGLSLSIVDEVSDADLVILPMSWNYYYKKNMIKAAMTLIRKAREHKKLVWTVLFGDTGLPIPNFDNIIVFRASGNINKLPKSHYGLPVFISDPMQYKIFNKPISFPSYDKKPRVGFCGQASGNVLMAIKQLLRIGLKNIGYYLKIYRYTPEAFIVGPYLRYKCLKKLERSKAVCSNFIRNKKYRAGANTEETRLKSTKMYFNNMIESQYVLCTRGAGNFSVRFYETLAMGRIPIYLDTDGPLPLSETIDWNQHIVWIKWDERFQITEKVLEFHDQLDSKSIQALSVSNRNLWKNHLQLETFFKNHLNKRNEISLI